MPKFFNRETTQKAKKRKPLKHPEFPLTYMKNLGSSSKFHETLHKDEGEGSNNILQVNSMPGELNE